MVTSEVEVAPTKTILRDVSSGRLSRTVSGISTEIPVSLESVGIVMIPGVEIKLSAAGEEEGREL